MEKETLLKVENLVVHYETHNEVVEAVNNVSFEILSGQTLGLVGETGAGKTTIALAIMRLLPKTTGKVIQGSIHFDGKDIQALSTREMRAIRGHDISMIFQDPMSSLNPVLPIDEPIAELIRLHRHVSRAEAAAQTREILKKVGIQPDRAGEYPRCCGHCGTSPCDCRTDGRSWTFPLREAFSVGALRRTAAEMRHRKSADQKSRDPVV